LARRERRALREATRKISRSSRLAACGRKARGEWVEVKVENGTAHFAGLGVCGLVWTCPVCGPKIRQGRAVEIGGALGAALDAGYGIEFATLTLRHHRGQRLDALYSAGEAAWKSVQQSRRYRSLVDRLGLVGIVQAREITYGHDNGWHPHRHMAMVFRHALTSGERAELEQVLWEVWNHQLQRRGLDSLRGPGAVVKPVTAAEGLGWYLTKVGGRSLGVEMARGDLKKGRKTSRTPEEILRDAVATGDVADIRLWQEYEEATAGRKMITWSQGLRQALIGQAEEVDDQELADAEVGGEVVAALDVPTWRVVERASPGGVAALEAAEKGPEALEGYLRRVAPPGGVWRVFLPKVLAGA
jgi:hypothetical protein